MYEFAGSKSAKLVVTESGKLVARFLQYIACLTRVQIYNKISHVALCFAVFHRLFYSILFYLPCPWTSNTSTAWLWSKTHTKRRAAQHGRLPSLLGDGDKGIEKVYGEGKNILYWAD
jgi:hypothetical protein